MSNSVPLCRRKLTSKIQDHDKQNRRAKPKKLDRPRSSYSQLSRKTHFHNLSPKYCFHYRPPYTRTSTSKTYTRVACLKDVEERILCKQDDCFGFRTTMNFLKNREESASAPESRAMLRIPLQKNRSRMAGSAPTTPPIRS